MNLSPSYPTEAELKKIRKWEIKDSDTLTDILTFVWGIWTYRDEGYARNRGRTWWFSTAGWSGNEDIIGALKENRMFWLMCAYSWRRGGHFKFKVPKIKR